MGILTTYSKTKGREAEREVAEIFCEAGFPCLRNERNSGGGEDLSHEIPGVWIEVKRQERLSVPAALRQAQKAAKGKKPMVIHRSNRQEWLATVPFTYLIELLQAKHL